MYKRLLLMSLFCIGLITLWGADANAYPPRLGGWPTLTGGSVIVKTTWIGIANTELKPTHWRATIIIPSGYDVIVQYQNPATQKGGVGVPFRESGIVEGTSTINPTQFTGKGKWEDTITFGYEQLKFLFKQKAIDAGSCLINDPDFSQCIDEYLNTFTPNPKWTAYDIDVLHLDARIEAYTNMNTRCEDNPDPNTCFNNEEEVVHANLFGCDLEGGVYVCTTQEKWEWKNNTSECPTLPPHTGSCP